MFKLNRIFYLDKYYKEPEASHFNSYKSGKDK